MPRAFKVCTPGRCPMLVPSGKCPACRRATDRARGSRQHRGYGREHEQQREHWRPLVERGEVDCAAPTCIMPSRRIQPGQAWDLGHTEDRRTWRGPEHARCNRGWRRNR